MRFNVASSPLLAQLQAVNKVINGKNAIQILDNFLIKVEGNLLYITGSDQENVLTATVEISDSESDGSICIPAKRLIDNLKEVGNQGLSFDINEETFEVEIKYLNGHYELPGVDPAEYPQRKIVGEESLELDLPSFVISKGIENTLFAVAPPKSIRPIMTGIFWDIHPEDITFVSSDTHKLVRYINSSIKPGVEFSFTMPAKPANILKEIAGKDGQMVHVRMDDKNAVFTFDTIELSCQFINGKYPPYNRVIPVNNPFTMNVDRGSLLGAARRVALSASMASGLLCLDISAEQIVLTGRDLDYAISGEEKVACSYEGNPMVIGFNSTFLIDELNNLSGSEVVIKLADPARPGIFVPAEQDEGEDLLMLLMPLQVFE